MIRASSSGGRRDSPRLAQRCHARLVNASQARLSRGWLWSLVVAGVLVQTALNLLRPITTYKLVAFGAGGTTIGLVTAAYAVLPIFIALSLGRLTDRTPRLRRLIMAAAALMAVGGLSLALAPSIAALALGSVVLGLAHLVFTISGQAAIARFSDDADLDLGFGWFTASYSVGQALGPLLGGAIVGVGAVTASPERLADVDRALWVGAAISLLAVPLLLASPHRPPARPEPADDAGTASSPSTAPAASLPTAAQASSPSEPGSRATIPQVLRAPGVASNMLASMGLLAMVDILSAFLPLVGEDAGVPPIVVGALLAIRGAAGILSRALLPWLSRRWSRRRLLITCLLVASITLAVPPLVLDQLVVAGTLLAVGGFFLGIGQPLTMTLIATAVPTQWRSQALAVRLMGNRVGQVGFPLLAGLAVAPFGPGGCDLDGGHRPSHRRRGEGAAHPAAAADVTP